MLNKGDCLKLVKALQIPQRNAKYQKLWPISSWLKPSQNLAPHFLFDFAYKSGPDTWITNSKQYGYESGYQEPWINNGQYPEWNTNNNNGWSNGYNIDSRVDEWIRYYRNAWIRNGDFLEPWSNCSKWKSMQSMLFSVVFRWLSHFLDFF